MTAKIVISAMTALAQQASCYKMQRRPKTARYVPFTEDKQLQKGTKVRAGRNEEGVVTKIGPYTCRKHERGGATYIDCEVEIQWTFPGGSEVTTVALDRYKGRILVQEDKDAEICSADKSQPLPKIAAWTWGSIPRTDHPRTPAFVLKEVNRQWLLVCVGFDARNLPATKFVPRARFHRIQGSPPTEYNQQQKQLILAHDKIYKNEINKRFLKCDGEYVRRRFAAWTRGWIHCTKESMTPAFVLFEVTLQCLLVCTGVSPDGTPDTKLVHPDEFRTTQGSGPMKYSQQQKKFILAHKKIENHIGKYFLKCDDEYVLRRPWQNEAISRQ